MLGYMNKCPNCGSDSHFVPEEMECDKSLVLWCRECSSFINQTLTLETIRRWWARVDDGEESIEPPLSREQLEELLLVEQKLNENRTSAFLEKIELHIKDFSDYRYTEEEDMKHDAE